MNDNSNPGILIYALTHRQADSAYNEGVLDLLSLLGLVRLESGVYQPTGEVARMLLDSLAAHLHDGVAVGLDWDDLDRDGLRGVDLLKMFEQERVSRLVEPSPARAVQVTQAVIKAVHDGEDVYLMQYDRHGGHYQPIGGKRDPGDADSAAALRREMMEELVLDHLPGPDECSLLLLRSGWQITEISRTYGILTAYSVDFYVVRAITFPIKTDQDTCWLSRREMAEGIADDGRAISPILVGVLGLDWLDSLPRSTTKI
nr:NUDIX domain-containing protein [Anaerolineae bacterium]